jgi:hypothetical protein
LVECADIVFAPTTLPFSATASLHAAAPYTKALLAPGDVTLPPLNWAAAYYSFVSFIAAVAFAVCFAIIAFCHIIHDTYISCLFCT